MSPTLGNSISFFEGHARSARYPSLAEPGVDLGVDLVGLAASLVLEDRVRRAGVQQERRRCVTALYLSRHRIVPRNNFRATSTGLTPSFTLKSWLPSADSPGSISLIFGDFGRDGNQSEWYSSSKVVLNVALNDADHTLSCILDFDEDGNVVVITSV